MVIHNKEQQEQWAEKRREQSAKPKSAPSKSPRPISVMAVQSSVCAVLLMVVLLFRVAGGAAYTRLQSNFADALAGNELMAVLMRLLDSDTASEDVKQENFTSALPLG